MSRLWVVATALPVVLACNEITAPRLPDGAVPMAPMAVFARWWSLVEQCSARTRDFNRVSWYVVPGAESIPTDIGNVQGMWLPGDHIVIAGQSIRYGPLVRHEMLHALLQTTVHPRGEFIGRCDGIVVCEEACRTNEPEPPGDPAAVAVAPSALEISVAVSPESPGIDILDGHIEVIVSARNPSTQSVVLQLAPPKDDGLPVTWRYSIWRGSAWWNHDERAHVVETTRFRPGETKRMVYDLWVGGAPWQEPFDAGTYDVYGAYNANRTATPTVMTIRPTAVCCERRREVR